ncbi:3-oxo-tetronate kinase [Lichenicoccus roseus]|uniref:3-oxo-tetronate kinase n=1 Tax=Lichenicoccus roseus TaxID=2683649 RepID=A0A5R9J256_9PROT|nr:3-oxo-tetronate kinase [Lichenicoccus roseus]TLU71720.1 four-carbon acid sugar kinase family protein [Lichenicoccus roseus]
MTLLLGCIADDYTGASDLASMLSRCGLRTVQTIGVPPSSLELPEVDAVVVALKSRSIEAHRAVELSLEAESWLRGRGAGHVLFKICSTFDSTDAGNIGPVLDALRARAGGGIVAVNPAFIETGRTVYQGHLFVNGVPLHESPLKDHPLNPMHDSNLVRVLARQSASPVGLVPLAVIEQGPDAIRAALQALASDGNGSAILDSVAPRHLLAIGEAALSEPVSTGASGIGYGLARALVAREGLPAHAVSAVGSTDHRDAHAAILAGSCSAATLRQIEVAERRMPCLKLDIDALLDGPAEAQRALDWATQRLAKGPILIASSTPPEAVRATQARHGGPAAGHAVEQALAGLAEGLLAAGLGQLIVAGGETSGAVVDRLGLQAFLIGPEIAPGVPVLQAVGARSSGLMLALKSGNFGGDDFFLEALAKLRDPDASS